MVETLDLALKVVNLIGVVAVGVYTWWTNRDRATAAAIQSARAEAKALCVDLDKALTEERRARHELEMRAMRLEQEMEHRLRLQDLEDLWTNMSKVNRELGEMSARLTTFNTQLQLHQEFLMRRE